MNTTKIDKPPFVHNWARYVHPDVHRTTQDILRFVRAKISRSYHASGPVACDVIERGLDRETALQAVLTRGRENSREMNAEYISALCDYSEVRQFNGVPSFTHMGTSYQVNRNISIPVKPTAVIVENGLVVPIFSFGWSSIPFTEYQRRLIMTVLEDAVFSLTDFESSPAELLFFPKKKIHGVKPNRWPRTQLVWRRGDVDLLKNSEMIDQMKIYLEALETAKQILAEERESPKPGSVESEIRVSSPDNQTDLFD